MTPPVWWLNVFQFCESGRSLLKKTHFTNIFRVVSQKCFTNFASFVTKKSSGPMGRHLQHLESEGGFVWQAHLADLTHDGTIELESKGS
jgi:hypothetical protein